MEQNSISNVTKAMNLSTIKQTDWYLATNNWALVLGKTVAE